MVAHSALPAERERPEDAVDRALDLAGGADDEGDDKREAGECGEESEGWGEGA
jgi:hypothetical protein